MNELCRIPDLPRFKWPWLLSSFLRLDPAWDQTFRRAGLGSVREIMSTTRGQVVSWDRKRQKNDVLLVELERGGERVRFFIKRCFNFRWRQIWRRAFRGSLVPPSMVRKEYANLRWLGRRGFDVPEMIGYGEERYAGGLVMGVLISREIPDAIGVDGLVHSWLPLMSAEQRRRVLNRLVMRLADVTRRLHEQGFEHHDYFLRNLMVSKGTLDRVFILDCPRGARRLRFLMPWRSCHDLATLDAASQAFGSRTDRMRFFLRYRQHRRLTPGDKALIRRILRRADPWRARQERRLTGSLALHAAEPSPLKRAGNS